ncbi:Transcription factor IIIB 50 kDa subunit [Oryzias melastigma]|uniref:Transcription factor IIIB 50 kDa subunit n=1 Tax=Oryzias melastigma TaxID=30732 RepID=A0A834BSS0_ORYME|nr:Transcription factor IIIB 50 kDa subunit [Oryzias melastigma]
MPRRNTRCPGCGSSNIVNDNLYCQAQQVCADCGTVVSEGSLAQDPYNGPEISYSRTTVVKKKPCVNLIQGMERVKEMSRLLRVRKEVEELSLTYYRQAYEHKTFLNVTLQRKEILGGCCVLASCRQQRWPITLNTVSYLLNDDPAVVGEVYHEMIKVLNIQAPAFSVTDVMEAHCQEYKINPGHVPDELAEESRVLTKRAVALVELAADSWIVTGRHPLPIMMAAVYLAWQSLKPNPQRLKMSLEKFCRLGKVQKIKVAGPRITEMKGMLCKLGKEIPWYKQVLTPDNVVSLVGDILQHRYSLLRRAMKAHELSLLEKCPVNSPPAETPSSEVTEHAGQTPATSSVNAENEAGDKDESPKSPSELSDPQAQGSTQNWGKRVLFAPPCVVNPKKKKTERPALHVSEDDHISDSEIDSYIRTPQEARDFAVMQTMLKEQNKV